MKVRADMGSTVRDGFMATLQFEPGDSFSSILDLYYSTMEQTDNARSLEVNLSGYPAPCCVPGPFPDGTVFGYSDTTIEGDMAVAGTLNSIVPLVRNFLFTTEDKIMAGGWRNEFQLSDAWSLVADISYSRADRDQNQPEINAQLGPADSTGHGHVPAPRQQQHAFALVPVRLHGSDHRCWSGPRSMAPATRRGRSIVDELTSFRLDALREADMGWFVGSGLRRQLQRAHEGQVIARDGPQHHRRPRLPDRRRVPAEPDQPELCGCRRGACAQRSRRARRVLQPDRLRKPEFAALSRRQVLGRGGRGLDGLRAWRHEPRDFRHRRR